MARIPRTEASVDFAAPKMPTISGDSYAAPGKALASLGSAISSLGGSLEATNNRDAEFQDKLDLLNWDNSQREAQIKSQNEFNREDPNGFAIEQHTGRTRSFNTDLFPKLRTESGRKQAQLHFASRGHNYYETDLGFEYGKRESKIFADTSAATTNEFSKIDISDPDKAGESVTTALAGVNAIIKASPLKDNHKRALESEAAKLAIDRLRESYTTSDRMDEFYPAVTRMLQNMGVQPSAPGQAAPAPNTGKVSVAPASGDHSFVQSGSGARFRVSSSHAQRFAGLINDLEAAGLKIDGDQSGGFADRNIAGTNTKSRHAFGEAIDLNWNENARGKAGKIREIMPVEQIRQLAAKHGLKWGGDWKNPDDMHFEVDSSANYKAPPVAQRGLTAFAGRGVPPRPASGIEPKVTAYSPQAGGALKKMEGGYAAAKPGPDGKAEVRTLEDYAAGKSEYITVAGDPSQYGKTYTIPEITWIDSNGKVQKSTNVKAVVHDTGSAFKGAGEGKFDIPVAKDMTDAQMNAQPFLRGKVAFIPAEQGGQATAAQPEKQKVVLAGLDAKAKAAKYEELVSQGYQSVTHQVDKDGNDVLIAHKADKPAWYINSRGKGGTSELDRPEFAGPEWAGESIKKVRTGELRAANSIPGSAANDNAGKPVRVADSSGAIPQSAQPGQSAITQFREGLLRNLDSYAKEHQVAQERWAKETAGKIEQIVKIAQEGGPVGDQMFDDITDKLDSKPELAEKFGLNAMLESALRFSDEQASLRVMSPAQLETVLNMRRRGLVANIDKLPANVAAAEQEQIKRIERLHDTAKRELKDDQLAWAEKTGIAQLEPLGQPGSLAQRVYQAEAVASHFGGELRLFTNQEKEKLAADLKQGGKAAIGMLGMMHQELGPERMMGAMAEIGDQAPAAATVGWMVASGHPMSIIEDAAEGLSRQNRRKLGEKDAKPDIKPTDVNKLFNEVTQGAFARMERGPLVETALAVYEARFHRLGWDKEEPEQFKSIIREIVGERKDKQGNTYGGIQTVGGWRDQSLTGPSLTAGAVILPSNVKNDTSFRSPFNKTGGSTFKQLMDALRPDDLAVSVGGPGVGLMPTSKDGKPLSIGAIRQATPVTVGDGRYMLATRSVSGGDPGWVSDGTGKPYILDLKALEPVLKSRRPDLYFGYDPLTTPQPAMPAMPFQSNINEAEAAIRAVDAVGPKGYRAGPVESENVVDDRASTVLMNGGRRDPRAISVPSPVPKAEDAPPEFQNIIPKLE